MKYDVSAVYEAQKYLRAAARIHPEIGKIVPDGIYGEETAQAAREFQRIGGLPRTGRVDLDTWNALVETNVRVCAEAARPIPIAPITNDDLPLRRGDSGLLVLTAQQMLQHFAQQYSNMPSVMLDGIFGGEMELAVMQWQEICLLPKTGEIDKATWNRLAQFYTMK